MYNENFFIKATTVAWGLFLVGLCALCTSILLVFLVLEVKLTAITLVFYLIGLFLVGPTMGAVYQTVFQIMDEPECKVIRSYFNHYGNGFKSSILLWLPYYTVILIVCADIYFVSLNNKDTLLLPLLYLILIIALISYVYSLVLNTKFIMKVKDIFRFSLFLLINRPVKSLTIILLLSVLSLFCAHFAKFAVFWGFPLFSMLTLFSLRNMLAQIEEKYVES